MTPLFITAFFDGRLGHEKQTKGILQALSGLTPVRIQTLRHPASGFRNGFQDWRLFLQSRIVSVRKEEGQPQSDLIIGTGSRIHIPMVLYKEQYGGRLVTCMTPDPIFRRRMDLCFIPRHDNPRPAGNIFVTIGPPNTAMRQDRHDSRKGLILVGGIDHKSHRWDSARLMIQIRHLTAAENFGSWTISSSPRTPPEMLRLLTAFAAETPRIVFVESKDTPDGWIEDAYAAHESVWVTADSISMIYEALTAGCHVGILPVLWKRMENKFQQSLAYLVEQGLATTFEDWSAGRPLSAPRPPLDEASRCAREILARWWPERL
ncbi:MAG: mitochondrial fission ELM1 family protein [Thermodesulfobacteriota bacterium]